MLHIKLFDLKFTNANSYVTTNIVVCYKEKINTIEKLLKKKVLN